MSRQIKSQSVTRLIKITVLTGAMITAFQFYNTNSQETHTQQREVLPLKTATLVEQSTEKKVAMQLGGNKKPSEDASLGFERKVIKQTPNLEYTVQHGDTLSHIFNSLNLSYVDLRNILETDLNNLSVDNLKQGNVLRVWLSPENHKVVSKLELEFNLADRVLFTRNDKDNSFDYESVHLPGTWKEFPISGEIKNNFSKSALGLGIPATQTNQIAGLLKEKLDLNKDIHSGDRFEVIQKRQYIDGKSTGNSKIEAVRVYGKDKYVGIYQHTDGEFYDQDGNSLNQAFMRYPSNKPLEVTSQFNPNRRHPVTGRISPHNGVDFKAQTGTPVLATGDGVVTLTANHPYAGRYVVIQNSSKYTTRFLHMSKIDVKVGDTVHSGEKIGEAGATGRVTGPHIHYEFIVNNKPVNPLTADIPMEKKIPKSEMDKFDAHIAKIDQLFEEQNQMLAKTEDSDEEREIRNKG